MIKCVGFGWWCLIGLMALLMTPAVAEQSELTAAGQGIELPDGLGERIPFPDEVDVGAQRLVVGTYYINFRFSMAWPEAMAFFASALPEAGWEVIREQLPEQPTGPRTALWQATGHGAVVTLSLQTAGGVDGSHSAGVLQVRPD